MTTWIALLRAVNVGGTGKIGMADLRSWLGDLGFAEPRSLLQSGNLVFRGKAAAEAGLERLLQREAAKRFGLSTTFFVRDANCWSEIVSNNPFPGEAKSDPSHLMMIVLKENPDAECVDALQVAISGPERLRVVGRQVYVTYPLGIADSRLTLGAIEKKLGVSGTGRNWNTVLKIAALSWG